MAERKVTFLINANVKNFTKGLNSAQTKFKRFGQNAQRLGMSLTAKLTAPILGLSGVAVKTAANFETLRQSMDILNGSAEEGARNFERLKRFSAQTPFQLTDLAKAQNMLQGFGQSADDAFDSIKMIGDIAAVSGGDIQGIGIAFGQAAAEGRLMTRDIRQLINQGVPAIKLLADTMGVAESEVLDLASQGEISFDILQQSFRDATSEGGMFADGMKKQSKTIGGLFSTLRDNVSLALGELGQIIIEEIDLKRTVKQLTMTTQLVVKRFKDMSSESRGQIIRLAKLLAASGPLAIAIGQAAKFVVLFSKLVTTSFFKAVAPVVGFIGLVNEMTKALARIHPQMRAAFLVGMEKAKEKLGDLVSLTGNWMLEMTGASEALEALNAALKEGLNFTEDYSEANEEVVDGIKRASVWFETARERTKRLGEAFLVPIKKTREFTKEAISLGEALQSQVSSSVISFSETLADAFTGDAGATGFFNNILLVVADFSAALGKALVAAGVAALAFKKLLLNPLAAIGAGAALIVTSRVVRNLLVEGPAARMAEGGIVPGGFPNDTYPALLSSGETVIPSPKSLPSFGMNQKIEVPVYLNDREIARAVADYGKDVGR